MKRLSLLFATLVLLADPLAAAAFDAASTRALAKLENKFFGHTFASDPVEQRTERLEKLILGDAGSGTIEERVGRLCSVAGDAQAEAQADGTVPAAPTANSSDAGAQSSYPGMASSFPATDPSETQQDYPHIDELESTLLGKTYRGQPLAARLARMEARAFGAPSSGTDLSARTDALDQYVQKRYPKSPAAAQAPDSDDSAGANGGAQSHSAAAGTDGSAKGTTGGGAKREILAIAANAVLGLASMASPIGFAGVGPGAFGMQPSGRRLGAAGQQPDSTAEQHAEDPAINAPTPPPDNARMATKVGWCEMQLFGRTFTDMHLEERLTQLSAELHFETQKSGLQLMDYVGDMVKLVQKRKQPAPHK